MADAKRGKTRASESRLVLVLLLIGSKIGANFLSQSCSVANAKPITFRHSNENRSNNTCFSRASLAQVTRFPAPLHFFRAWRQWLVFPRLAPPALPHFFRALGSSFFAFSFSLCLTFFLCFSNGFFWTRYSCRCCEFLRLFWFFVLSLGELC